MSPNRPSRSTAVPLHLDPRAYLLGLQGLALMRAYAGEYDADLTADRIEAIRRLVAEPSPCPAPVTIQPMSFVDGYETWSRRYDDPGNGFFDLENPVVRPWLDAVPRGVAIDVGCGTGRQTAYLHEIGHDVRGFDGSTHMLALARAKLPNVAFEVAQVDDLPVDDASVDLVTCFIALTHVQDLDRVFEEFARVLRPGGALVISDSRTHFIGSQRNPLGDLAPSGELAYIPGWNHSTASYLRASLDQGFIVRDCHESVLDLTEPTGPLDPPAEPTDPGVPEIWDLHTWDPVATWAAKNKQPMMIFLRLEKQA